MPLRLVVRNLLFHPIRTLLTLGSLVVAVFLLCFLRSSLVALGASVEAASSSRLIVQSAVSLFVGLPLSYESKLAGVDGVENICKWTWFGGVYKDPSNFFGQFATDPRHLLEIYPEMEIVDGEYEEFIGDRTGCVVGAALARRFDWGVGDPVPLIGAIYPRTDGSAWEFRIRAIYDSTASSLDNQTMFFQHEYFEESIESGAAQGDLAAGVYVLKVAPGTDPVRVMSDVDGMFENGPQRVQATTEAEFNRQFVSMMGNIPFFLSSIGFAVLFAIFLAVLNTMMMAGRERTRDIGIMKAVGFSGSTAFGLLLAESLLLCGLGGALGIGLTLLMKPMAEPVMAMFFPGFHFDARSMGIAFAISIGIGILAAIGPAVRAVRLEPVEALRSEK